MPKHILHIDDEIAIREVLAESLSEQGYRVTSVAGADEAMAAISREKPDLVITDLQMDVGDGLEIMGEIRRRLPGVPVILLTGVLIDPRVARQSVAKQADAYLEKTAPLSRIAEEIRRLLGS